MAARNVSYKVKCRGCGREFIVRKPMELLPEHPVEPSKGKEAGLGVYLPCSGSGHTGIPIETMYL
jgi:hypothetical protein